MTEPSTAAAARVPLRGDPLPPGVARSALLAGHGGDVAFAGWYGSLALLLLGAAVMGTGGTAGMFFAGLGAFGAMVSACALFLWLAVGPSFARLVRCGAAGAALLAVVLLLPAVDRVTTAITVERAVARVEPLVATLRAHPGVERMDVRGAGAASLNGYAGSTAAPEFGQALAEAGVTRAAFDGLHASLRAHGVTRVESMDGYVALRLRLGVDLLHVEQGLPPPAPDGEIFGYARPRRTPLGGGWYRY